ncbi:MAG: glycosyltransferase [Actinomycetota bacterium]
MSTGQSGGRSVSVVIPIGRADEDLTLQLDALAGQSYPDPWELVLSLNAPGDDARAALDAAVTNHLQRDEDSAITVTVVDSSSVRSASHARNVGAEAASGELLLFCDGDDIADEDWMAELVVALDRSEAVGGHLEEELLAVPGQEDWRPLATPGALPTFLGFPYLVSANMGVVRAVFQAIGGFDTTLIRGEDIALSWDLIEKGVELDYAPAAVMHYRHRRGLWPMMHQHYLYGRGMSEIMARRGRPGDRGGGGLRALKPNAQPVARKNAIYFVRRGSIAAGRLVGLGAERLRQQRSVERVS